MNVVFMGRFKNQKCAIHCYVCKSAKHFSVEMFCRFGEVTLKALIAISYLLLKYQRVFLLFENITFLLHCYFKGIFLGIVPWEQQCSMYFFWRQWTKTLVNKNYFQRKVCPFFKKEKNVCGIFFCSAKILFRPKNLRPEICYGYTQDI